VATKPIKSSTAKAIIEVQRYMEQNILDRKKDPLYLGQPTDIVIKKKGMWPSCVERYTPKPVSQ
jgi:hypothetical protein